MRNGLRWHPVWWVALLLTAAVGLFARVVAVCARGRQTRASSSWRRRR